MATKSEKLLTSLKRQEGREGQGRLKIYLGMVAGVGKTYAMLKNAHQLRAQGEDVVVGFIETHGRKDTIEQIGDLEVLQRKKIEHRGVILEEMDLDLVLKRKPKIVLVDEFAHTNVPGSRHPKRYQDVLEILGQGIDVHTTLNVQHFQSRTDAVARITGVMVQEVVPDALIDRADEILFIDQNPDVVIERLRRGKIYALDKAEAAASNFFKASNLTALREMGLRLMAQRVDHELSEMKTLQGVSGRSHHHLLVAVFASPFSEYLMRWTRRQAYALNCPWSAVYVRTSQILSEQEETLLRKNLETARDLGGELVEIQDDNVVEGILAAARQQEATQLVLGKPRARPWWKFWLPNITNRLLYEQQLLDVHVVSPPEHEVQDLRIPRTRRTLFALPTPNAAAGSILVVAVATVLNLLLLNYVAYHALGLIYMLSFSLAAIFMRQFSVTLAAVLSALLWNLVFIPPRFTFAIAAGEDWLMLLLYLVTAAVIGTFTRQLRQSEERIKKQAERTGALYRMTKGLAAARDATETIFRALEQLKEQLGVEGAVWVVDGKRRIEDATPQGAFAPEAKEQAALQWAYLNRRPAGRFTDTLPSLTGHYIPLVDQTGAWGVLGFDTTPLKEYGIDSRPLVESIAQQLSFALGRDHLFRQLQDRQVREESEKIYKTLLNSVSHELRTPLTAIHGFAGALSSYPAGDEFVRTSASEIDQNAHRLDEVVRNFLDMGRIEAGQLKLQKRETDLAELLRGVWTRLKKHHGQHQFRFHLPAVPVIIALDAVLLAQAIENVLKNALTYTPEHSTIEIHLSADTRHARVLITDNGAGLGEDPEQVFEKFWRANPLKTGGTGLGLSISRAFVELHGGTLKAENLRGGGAAFKFTIPLEQT